MNKKGFTLIEIITVVGILGVISILITVNLNNTLKETSMKKCQEFKADVEASACSYASLTKLDASGNKMYDENDNRILNCDRKDGSCTFTLKLLYDEGMIDMDTNPCNEQSLKTNPRGSVTVSWDGNGEKKCQYNEN